MFEKLVWAAWGWSTGASFRVGMWFVRLSSYRLCRSYNSVDNGRWSIDHWSRESGRLSVEDRVAYSEFVSSLLWFVAEPAQSPAAGAVPWSQHALIVELLANRWSGGRAADLVALVDEVMAAEDLVIS